MQQVQQVSGNWQLVEIIAGVAGEGCAADDGGWAEERSGEDEVR